MTAKRMPRWPLILIALPAAVAVWSGWVGLGQLCGFGVIHPLPGIWDNATINTAITLPIGVEAYGAHALGAWLTPGTSERARRFARWSAIGALTLGMLGQVAYHLLAAVHATSAPWPVTMFVSCLPVIALALGTALAHLLREPAEEVPQVFETGDTVAAVPIPPPVLVPVTVADAAPVDPPVTPASTPQDGPPDADTEEDTEPATTRTRGGQATADKVATLRARHPDMTQAQMASRLKVSERTVRRHLASASMAA